MRRHLIIAVLLAACGPPAGGKGPTRAAAPPSLAPEASAMGPVMVKTPEGWINILKTPRDEVEAIAPGFYDNAFAMAQRNGYLSFAFDLSKASPDQGSMMTMLPYGKEGPVDQAFLEQFVETNNMGVTAADVVDKKILAVRGRPVGKLRAEYDARSGRIATLVYLFPSDQGEVIQLVFVVKADRYEALRPEIETIERTDDAVQQEILKRTGH